MSLTTALFSATDAMRVFERSLEVAQTNVGNVNTPGYAKQRQEIISFRDGIQAGRVISSRDLYNESSVWQRQSGLGAANQQIDTLSQVEQALPIGENLGVAASLSSFFASFTQLAVSPNSTSARQVVLDKANTLATDFNTTANRLARSAQSSEQEIRSAVSRINGVLDDIAGFNKAVRLDGRVRQDGGVESRLYKSLESLSEYADFKALPNEDGSISVYLGGQTLGVIGDSSYQIHSVVANNQVQILDSQGADITGQFQSGRLGSLLNFRNKQFATYSADLDKLAQRVADQVNTTLASGLDQSGAPPVQNLFNYSAVPPNGAASTLVAGPLAPQDLAVAGAASPGGNANALTIADLAKQPSINGYTYTQFYGATSAKVGTAIAAAKADQNTETQLLTQAQTIRANTSGVSLDEEAAYVLQIQRSYQAVSKLLTVISSMTDTVMGIIK